jgi:hypothetical protein
VPEAVTKRKATNVARYGHENPFGAEPIKQRIRDTNLVHFGVPNPNQSPVVMAKRMATNQLKYGVDHFFQTKGFLDKYLTSTPNKLEQRVALMLPDRVIYTGDGTYWVKAKGALRARNPDFVVLSDGQLRARQAGVDINDLRTSAVIEVLGSYWHGPKMTGQTCWQHKCDMVDYYRACGIRCLAIWEDEVLKHPKRVTLRIQRFLQKWAA